MLKKADATDNNTGDGHASRATLNTTGVRRKRSPARSQDAERDTVASIGGHQTPEHQLQVVGGRPLPYPAVPNDHELFPRGELRHRRLGV